MQFTLSREEQELLLRTLEQRHQGLLREIWHTDHREFRIAFREDERMLESLLNRLRETPVEQTRG